ncbi:MAG: hypothetical protein KKB20_04750 [Proteobacteria bacterium]|nr:hypothetical protein [Pseudomonadota bacterium]
MNPSDMFLHPFCFPELEQSLRRTEVMEIAPEVWLLQGNLGLDFFLAPPSSNIFILRDGDLVFLLDTGLHPFYRTRVLDILARCRREGARTLVLMVSQGHWDHALNNDVVLEAGYEDVRFLLPEPEVFVIESIQHWLGDFREQEKYFTPNWKGWSDLTVQFEEYARTRDGYNEPLYQAAWEAIREAKARPDSGNVMTAVKLLGERVLFPGYRSLAERADVLSLAGRETRMFGDVEVKGWQVGRFFVIHDGSHSPGHICLYDPKNKLLISGDVTIEINPAFADTSMTRLLQASRNFRIMAEQGFVELAADAHRNRPGFTEVCQLLRLDPLHPVQLQDLARGREDCRAFFGMFEAYYRDLIEETLAAHARLGEASAPDILDELARSENRHVGLKLLFPFPSRPELLVLSVLKENGHASRRVDRGRILFSPPEKWRL